MTHYKDYGTKKEEEKKKKKNLKLRGDLAAFTHLGQDPKKKQALNSEGSHTAAGEPF